MGLIHKILKKKKIFSLILLILLFIYAILSIYNRTSNDTSLIKIQKNILFNKDKVDFENKNEEGNVIEEIVKQADTGKDSNNVEKSTAVAIQAHTKKKECKMRYHRHFPLCQDKVQYMEMAWSQIKCFKDTHKLDGSKCSILDYFVNVEPFCAPVVNNQPDTEEASMNFDLDGMLKLLPMPKYRWMRDRAKQLWPDWVMAGENFRKTKQKWKKKKVIAFLGSMGFQPEILEFAGKGGPLGELIQWTDVIASLYILGHDVTVGLNQTEFGMSGDKDGCTDNDGKKVADIIYADFNGVVMLNNHFGYGSLAKYRCTYRVLDSFGTFVEFNFPQYPHKIPGPPSQYSNMNLLPKQIMTLYPHTQDNNFLGFVIGSNQNLKNIDVSKKVRKDKKPIALIYAKLTGYMENHVKYLTIVNEYFELHATAVQSSSFVLPDFIVNHGSVSGAEVKRLLIESKLFVGVGFPYEGPGPIEAMAAGTVYLQPKYDIPRSKLNEKFFESKPTLRKLTSQSPYMEEFVGEPYCYTIDVKNEALLRKTLWKIVNMEPLAPKITREFTNEGMLERIHVYTDHMDFCNPNSPRWPPIEHLTVVFTPNVGLSCKDACMNKGMVCEREFFDDINSKESIERLGGVQCESLRSIMILHAPSYNPLTKICYVQAHGQLFSCMHQEANMKRLCPCRDYIKEQSALCPNCI